MSEKAEIINLKPAEAGEAKKTRLQLDSGRQIRVHAREKEEILEIVEPKGDIVMKVRLTEAGPVITVHGAHLELTSTETLTLDAKKIQIKAQEQAAIESKGSLEINASKKIGIHSDQDVRVVGKMIYLN